MQSPASKGRNFVQPAWERVLGLRNRKGWTQEKLAEKSRVSVRTIQNIERGKPTQFGTILKLAQALGVQAQECMLPASTQSDSRDILTPTSVDGHQFGAPACPLSRTASVSGGGLEVLLWPGTPYTSPGTDAVGIKYRPGVRRFWERQIIADSCRPHSRAQKIQIRASPLLPPWDRSLQIDGGALDSASRAGVG